ncbi:MULTISPECIES: exosortase/archaeosortase family protein [unclassified Cyanobium]|uniref:exosortase/archaeosortase family protein n=1 Tax=unclassified Cyanobium TaxID=2627006 RepID=UPI0020CBA2B6|nr:MULTISPECIES: exosortase/archaeosortase family protein [unclassified Cyanobium]MCP9833679.1 archaeosortase/exosortase family protein [Cyanobium sp. La Preciosa 7G6]MCP9936563.1 archaeosortase/exosortase family protein [Cyanobium sp. Aljojuca 7A6]
MNNIVARLYNDFLLRLPASWRASIPAFPPPTPRNLWLALSAAVAIQNVAVFQSSQSEHITVFSLLVWGGAVICMEDQFEDLEPRPAAWGLIIGTLVLLWVLTRSAVILHWDGLLFALAPIGGAALGLLAEKPSQLGRFRDPLLCLMLLPGFALLMRILPEAPISLLTARVSGFWLSILGLDVIVNARSVLLPGGGVKVLGPCNGVDLMAQILCVGVIFLLAFPIRSWTSRFLLFLAAPLIGLICNTFRIALLAVFAGNGYSKGSWWFDFFHESTGSLVFSGVAVLIFGRLYMQLLERELPPLPSPPAQGESS